MDTGPRQQPPAAIAKSDLLAQVAIACAILWALMMRFSSALFPYPADVRASGALSLATLVALLLFAVFGKRYWHMACLAPGKATVLIGSFCALVATMLPFVFSSMGALLVRYAATGLFAGVAAAVFLVQLFYLLKCCGFKKFVRLFLGSLCAATLGFALLSLVVPAKLGWTIGVFPLAYAVVALAYIQSEETMTLYTKNQLKEPIANETDIKRESMADILVFGTLLFLTGFLVAYMPTMYPKTSNLASYYLDTSQQLGLTSWRSLAALGLLLFLLMVVLLVLDNRRRAMVMGTAVVVGLFAATFFSLPSMSTSPAPYILITPAASVLALCELGALGRMRLCDIQAGLSIMIAGAVCAATFALVFLGPLYGKLPFQDWLFNLIPAGLLFVCATLSIFSWARFSAFLFPTSRAEDSRLVSTIDQVCASISAHYGLTARESQVLILLAEGRNEPYIESALSISRTTVKTHISHIYRKTSVSSRQELIDLIQSTDNS